MPLLECMISSVYTNLNVESAQVVNVDNLEYVTLAVLKTMCELCEGYSEVIRNNAKSRQTPMSSGVDLNREERGKKCTVCYESMRLVASTRGRTTM